MHNYARFPLSFVKGEGAYLQDTEGNQYLDALGGIAVCALGHSHPTLAAAIADQAKTLWHTSNLYGIDLQTQLADKLCQMSGLEKAYFANSGTEANEAAIKIARLWGKKQGMSRPSIVTMHGGFHGRTMGALSATPKASIQKGFAPLVPDFIYIDYDDIGQVKDVLTSEHEICAIMLEPIQGESGVVVPEEGYLQAIRYLCDQHQALMICDEVQTGIGRTGKWFAYQHEDILPDIVTSAKALGNGMPIGACLAGKQVAETLGPGSHGSTFGGNPLACRVALSVIEIIEQEQLLARAEEIGTRLMHGLEAKLGHLDAIIDIRGHGCMVGVELDRDCPELTQIALDKQLLVLVSNNHTVRLLPPYILSDSQVDSIIDTLATIITDFLQEN